MVSFAVYLPQEITIGRQIVSLYQAPGNGAKHGRKIALFDFLPLLVLQHVSQRNDRGGAIGKQGVYYARTAIRRNKIKKSNISSQIEASKSALVSASGCFLTASTVFPVVTATMLYRASR